MSGHGHESGRLDQPFVGTAAFGKDTPDDRSGSTSIPAAHVARHFPGFIFHGRRQG